LRLADTTESVSKGPEIGFLGVTEVSRCPVEVICVSEGIPVAQLSVAFDDAKPIFHGVVFGVETNG
jgi:hypothetical protein